MNRKVRKCSDLFKETLLVRKHFKYNGCIKSFNECYVPFYQNLLNRKDYVEPNFGEVQHVYLGYDIPSNKFKIGHSKNPRVRERTLQSAQPDFHMIAIWEAQIRIENELHALFDAQRVRGEWFNLSTSHLIQIREFMSKFEQVDVSMLNPTQSYRSIS